MTVNVTYREAGAVVPGTTTVKNSPLSNAEIDGNFKSVKDAVEVLSTSAGAGLIGVAPVGDVVATTVQAAIAELDSEKVNTANLAASSGSSLVGYDGGTVQDVLDGAKSLQDYAALRAYTGRATRIYITGLLITAKPAGIAGVFQYDQGDTTSIDNGGTVIVGADGRRWKRDYSGKLNVMWFGVVGNGAEDDTVKLQAALSSGAKRIFAPGGLEFLTTNTLFVTSSNTTVDFGGSKIKNLSNSRYAICLVTPNIAELTETALTSVLVNLHYGSEIKKSKIKNLVVSMSSTVLGGSNLGVGIVYGHGCTLSNIEVEQTNGNGLEVRNSTKCHVDNVSLKPRTYGAFFFMTKDCKLMDFYIAGCARGVCTKMSQAGKPVNFKATRGIVENLTSGLYYTVGGEWKERVLTDPIYQPGHEYVSDVTYEDVTFSSDTDQVKVDISYFASRFTYKTCTFKSDTSSAGANIGANGNQVPGEIQGKGHKFTSACKFINGSTIGNTCLGVGTDTEISDSQFFGSYQRLLIAEGAYNPVVAFKNNTINGVLLTLAGSANALFTREAGATLNVVNNIILMTLEFSGVGGDVSSMIANDLSEFSDNTVRISGSSTYTHTTATVVNGEAHGNNCYYKDFGGAVYSLYATGSANLQNNTIGNNGVVGAGSRAIYMPSSSIELARNEGNYVSGTWEYTQFAILPQNYQYSGRLKYSNVVPTTGTWARGDRVFNSVPAVGSPKSWVCTVAGTPGTWVSEGNL